MIVPRMMALMYVRTGALVPHSRLTRWSLVVDHLGVVQDVMTHRHVLISRVKQLTRGVLDERCAIGIELKLAIAQVVR